MKMKQYCVGRSFQCYTCFVAYLHKVKVDILVKICSSTKKHTKLRPFSRAAMLSFRIFTLELWVFFTQIPRKSAEISWKLIKRFSPQIISHLGGWIIYKRSKKTRTWRLQLRHLRKFWKHHRFFLEKTWCGSRILHEKHTPKKNFEKHLHDLSWLRPGFRTSVRLPLHVDGQDLSHQNHGRGWLGKAGVFFCEDVNDTVDASEIPRSPVEVGLVFFHHFQVVLAPSKRWLTLAGCQKHQNRMTGWIQGHRFLHALS